jgi:hypothetical protein
MNIRYWTAKCAEKFQLFRFQITKYRFETIDLWCSISLIHLEDGTSLVELVFSSVSHTICIAYMKNKIK